MSLDTIAFSMSLDEFPLDGGRVAAGVVRIGDTVRRPANVHSPVMRELLTFLEDEGFEGTPRFLGTDDKGRDILSFLDGDVPSELGHFDDELLTDAAMLLRRFHDATAPLARSGQSSAEVVCHNDWGPTNTVFRQNKPWGIIDFDTAASGSRLCDLSYSAFLWLDLGNVDYTAKEQARRLQMFGSAYDWTKCTPAKIGAAAIKRQRLLSYRGRIQGNTALAQWAAAAARWTANSLMPELHGVD